MNLTPRDKMRIVGSASTFKFVGEAKYDRGYKSHTGLSQELDRRYREVTGMSMRSFFAQAYDHVQRLWYEKASDQDALVLYPAQPGEFGIVAGLDESQIARHAIYVIRHNGKEIPIFISCFPPSSEIKLPAGGVVVCDHGHVDDSPGKSIKFLGARNYLVSPISAARLIADPFNINDADVVVLGDDHESDRYGALAIEKTKFQGRTYQAGDRIEISPTQSFRMVHDNDVVIEGRSAKISHGFPEDNLLIAFDIYKGGVLTERLIHLGDGVLTYPLVTTGKDPLPDVKKLLQELERGAPTVIVNTSGHIGYIERTEYNHGILSEQKFEPFFRLMADAGHLNYLEGVYTTATHLENICVPGQMIVDDAEKLSQAFARRKETQIKPEMRDIWEAVKRDPEIIRVAAIELFGEFGLDLDRPVEAIREKETKRAMRAIGVKHKIVRYPTIVTGGVEYKTNVNPFEYATFGNAGN